MFFLQFTSCWEIPVAEYQLLALQICEKIFQSPCRQICFFASFPHWMLDTEIVNEGYSVYILAPLLYSYRQLYISILGVVWPNILSIE